MKYLIILLLLVGIGAAVYLSGSGDGGSSDTKSGSDGGKVRVEEKYGFTSETVDP